MSKAGVQQPGKLGQHVRRRLGREKDTACQGWGFPGSHVSRSSLWPQASARREGPGQARGWHARDSGRRREVKPPLWAQGLSRTRPPAGGPWHLAVALPSRSWPALVLQCGLKQVVHL